MSNDLTRRLEQLERRMNSSEHNSNLPPGRLMVVVVHGALPPGVPIYGNAGANEWLREAGEDLDLFADRCALAARELGERLLVIGGLPQRQAQHDAAMPLTINGY
jgi:hypothetical protein